MEWFRDRALTLVLMGFFALFLAGQLGTGLAEFNNSRRAHGEAPIAIRRGGWVLRLYEHSLGLAFVLLFVLSWIGHAVGGFLGFAEDRAAHGAPSPAFVEYLSSSRFWFESLQNWQSEFLAIAAMVWLAVYLRQRRSPESKPVHIPHHETGR
jgi:hypothetical protein